MDVLGEAFSIRVKRKKTDATGETGALIHLTLERWEHVLDEHQHEFSYSDFEIVLDAVADPDYILRARDGARDAVVNYGAQFLHVFYREINGNGGFVITARYLKTFDRTLVIWRKDEHDRES